MLRISNLSKIELVDLAMVLYDIQADLEFSPASNVAEIESYPMNEYILLREDLSTETREQIQYARKIMLHKLREEDVLTDVEVNVEEETHESLGVIYETAASYIVTVNLRLFEETYTAVLQIVRPLLEQLLLSPSKPEPVIGVAFLSFTEFTTPTITIDSTSYLFTPMRDGLAFSVVAHCLHNHPDKAVRLQDLKTELKALAIPITASLTNLNQVIRKTIFDDKRALNLFLSVSPQNILVRSHAPITTMTKQRIISGCVQHSQ